MQDQQILGLFLERSEQAIEMVSKAYGDLCRHIAGNILQSAADTEECVNDAYLALWNTIPPEKPTSLRAYLTRLVRNIAYDRLDYRTAAKRDSRLQVCLQELEDCLTHSADGEAMLDAMVIRDTINAFLHTLPKNDRYIFLRRYYFLDTCRKISSLTGMTESAVSTRLGRLRQKLKERLIKEGIAL